MGLMRNIVIVDYRPQWPEMFASESRLIADTLGSLVLESHHVGSTSVPGLAAKPIIDIMLVVESFDRLDACNDAMARIGYAAKGELGIPGRRFFSKGSDNNRSHHLHAYRPGHAEIAAHLDFRDYLRARPDKARAYAELKKQLAVKYRDDIEAYVAGKEPLILEMLAEARRWRGAEDDLA